MNCNAVSLLDMDQTDELLSQSQRHHDRVFYNSDDFASYRSADLLFCGGDPGRARPFSQHMNHRRPGGAFGVDLCSLEKGHEKHAG